MRNFTHESLSNLINAAKMKDPLALDDLIHIFKLSEQISSQVNQADYNKLGSLLQKMEQVLIELYLSNQSISLINNKFQPILYKLAETNTFLRLDFQDIIKFLPSGMKNMFEHALRGNDKAIHDLIILYQSTSSVKNILPDALFQKIYFYTLIEYYYLYDHDHQLKKYIGDLVTDEWFINYHLDRAERYDLRSIDLIIKMLISLKDRELQLTEEIYKTGRIPVYYDRCVKVMAKLLFSDAIKNEIRQKIWDIREDIKYMYIEYVTVSDGGSDTKDYYYDPKTDETTYSKFEYVREEPKSMMNVITMSFINYLEVHSLEFKKYIAK